MTEPTAPRRSGGPPGNGGQRRPGGGRRRAPEGGGGSGRSGAGGGSGRSATSGSSGRGGAAGQRGQPPKRSGAGPTGRSRAKQGSAASQRQGRQRGRSGGHLGPAGAARDSGGPRTTARHTDAPTEPAVFVHDDTTVQHVSASEIRANDRRALILSVAAGVVPGVIVLVVLAVLVGVIPAVVAGVVVTAALMLVVARTATGAALRMLGARPIGDGDPRLSNVVHGLCATFGVPLPALFVIDDPVANACALGRTPADGVLVVTTGLLSQLDLVQIEGAVAHELAHIKRHDTAVAERALLVLSPVAAVTGNDRFLHAVLGAGREYRADELAAARVRYPPGLLGALATFERGPEPAPGSCFVGRRWITTRWIWIDPMVHQRGETPVGEIDATAVRMAALAEW